MQRFNKYIFAVLLLVLIASCSSSRPSKFTNVKTMEINFPAKSTSMVDPPRINNVLTFLLTHEGSEGKEGGIYYYYGEFYGAGNKGGNAPTILAETDFTKEGLHKLLLNRNKPTIDALNALEEHYKKKEIADTTYKRLASAEKGKRDGLTVLIKADDTAVYKNVVDLIDELNVCNVGKYALVDLNQAELDALNSVKKK